MALRNTAVARIVLRAAGAATLAAAGTFAACVWLLPSSHDDAASIAAVGTARAYGAQVVQRLQLAERSLRAVASDLRDPASAGVPPGHTAQTYFEAIARMDAGGRIEPLFGALMQIPPITPLNREELANGDSVLLTLERARQRPRVMLMRHPAGAAADGGLLVAVLAPSFIWGPAQAQDAALEICVRDDGDHFLSCSGTRLEPALAGLPAATAAEAAGQLAWRFANTHWKAGYVRVDLPVSTFGGVWTVTALEHNVAPQGLAGYLNERMRAALAALVAGTLVFWLAWRQSRHTRPTADMDLQTQAGGTHGKAVVGAREPGAQERQRRAISAMAEIDRAILSGADADRLVALATRLIRNCVDCDAVMLTLHQREGASGMTVLSGAPGQDVDTCVSGGLTAAPALITLLDAHPEGFWADRPGDLPVLAPLLERGIGTVLMLPVHEDARVAGVAALGVARREALGADACVHARALVVRLGVALTAAARARALYAHTHFDAITGLPNRRYLREHLGPQIARTRRDEQRLALLFIDLDGFKEVNAAAGHDRGDLILTEAAARLKNCLREEDILARFGGDEFVVVLPRIADGLDARKVADKVVGALSSAFDAAGSRFQLGASIGISLFPDDAQSVDELLRHADFAMFRAKAAGRGQYAFFNDEVNRKAGERTRLEGELRRATENEEFIVYYQPQIDMVGGQIEGAEALVRWLHPERGLVAPGEFISVAEQSSLILQIGEQVLRAACRQYREWAAAGIAPRRISVNVTGLELKRAGFADRIESILAEYGLRPFSLELEITESSLLENSTFILEQLERLRKRGIRIAFDDFGTGYSSLAYLKRLPVDVVKIDQSFVRDISGDADSASIIRAIIDMAHNLGKTVVAEGIETDSQRALLRDLGCEIGQGYLWSRPVPADQFERLYRGWKAAPRVVAPLRLVSA